MQACNAGPPGLSSFDIRVERVTGSNGSEFTSSRHIWSNINHGMFTEADGHVVVMLQGRHHCTCDIHG